MKLLTKILSGAAGIALFLVPGTAFADGGLIDGFNLAPFVPMVLDALMMVATGGYEFFVGRGDGIIYLLIWAFLAITIAMYLLKLYFPKNWVSFFGFSGGGDMAAGKADGMTIAKNLLNPGIRAIIATTVLLQIRPIFVTEWLVNPFLQFGAMYTHAITETIDTSAVGGGAAPKIECPSAIIEKAWISPDSCEFLVQPISDLSHVNNQMIKRGFDFVLRGIRGLTTLIPHGGEDFMNLVSGIILITTFVGCNLFMALLIIQAIFNMGMALILYPFQVLTWVIKPKNPEKWFDIWPAFSGIIKALQQLVITMIACAFILAINVAIVRALFQWNASVFMVAAGGAAHSNVPSVASNVIGFGGHSIMWLSAVLTFYLMHHIFEMTRQRLKDYSGVSDGLYKQVTGDAKRHWGAAIKGSKWIWDKVKK